MTAFASKSMESAQISSLAYQRKNQEASNIDFPGLAPKQIKVHDANKITRHAIEESSVKLKPACSSSPSMVKKKL